MRKNHPIAKPDLTVEEYAAADHLIISWSGDATSGTDQSLQQLGLRRRVALTINHFAPAISILKESNLIATLPPDYVRSHDPDGELFITTTPIDVPHTSISMLWHKRQDLDPGLSWLRKQIKKIYVPRKA